MPNYPALKEQDPTEPLDFSNLQFSLAERFKESAGYTYGHYQTNEIVNNLSHIKPDPSVPASSPITQEEIDQLKTERPNLNIPVGVPKFIGSMLASQYDDDKHFGLVSQTDPSIMGKIAGFGGSIVGGAADIKAMVAGFGIGGVGKTVLTTAAEKALVNMGAREIYGSAAARIGTLLAGSAGEAGGFGIGYQAEVELSEQQKRGNLNEPHEYIQSLQNVGMSGLYGVALGVGLGAIGVGLRGRPVMRFADGSFIDQTPNGKSGVYHGAEEGAKPWVADREGGLLNRPEFQGMKESVKDYLSKIYKPWSKDSDITMKEEATGQMLNGQGVVHVDPVLKQGMVDEGANFREATSEFGIDTEELDRNLEDAQTNIMSELVAEHFAEKFNKAGEEKSPFPMTSNVETYHNGPQFVTHIDHGDNVKVLKDKDQGRAIVVDSNIKENGVDGGAEMIKAAIHESQLRDLNFTSDSTITPNMMKVYRKLEKEGYKFKFNPDVTEKVGDGGNFKGKKVIESNDGTPVVSFESAPEAVTPEKISKRNRVNNLIDQYQIAQSMRDHINDTHERLTQDDMQQYGDYLKSSGMPDNGYTTHAPELTVDDYLKEFSDDQIKDLESQLGEKSDIVSELRDTMEKLKNQNVFVDMAKNMTDCILKGGL